MRNFLLSAVIVTSLLINSTESNRRLGIVGGRTATIEKTPYQAAYLTNGILKCGACIIDKEWALTAAHCVVNHSKNITLRVGSTYKDIGGTLVNVTQLIAHENFDKTKLHNDIALLKFDPIEFSAAVQPVELIGANDVLPDGGECLVSGWGLMEGAKKPRDLHAVNVDIVNQETCKNNYNSTLVAFKIVDSMLCAAVHEGSKDACSGDSGGPLVYNGKLCGIVSAGYGCGMKEYPGVYARVSVFLDWIAEKRRAATP